MECVFTEHRFAWEQHEQQQGQVVSWRADEDKGSISLLERDGSVMRLRTGVVAASISSGWAAVLLGKKLVLINLQHGNTYNVCENGAKGAVAAGDVLVVLRTCDYKVGDCVWELYRCNDCVPEQVGRYDLPTDSRIVDFNANREALAVTLQAKQEALWSGVHIKCVSKLTSSGVVQVPGCFDDNYFASVGFVSTPIGADLLATLEGNSVFDLKCKSLVRIWSFKHGEPECVYQIGYFRSVLTMVVRVPGVSMNWLGGVQECTRAEELAVIEDVQFDMEEPAATILSEEAADIAGGCWSSGIEHLLQAQHAQNRDLREAVLLTFSRETRELEDAALASSPALRAAATGVELKPGWGNGAKVLIAGIGPEHIEAPGVERLGPQHILVNRHDQAELLEALQHLPYRIRKLKPDLGVRSIPEQMSLLSMSSGDGGACEDDDSEPVTEDLTVETSINEIPSTEVSDVEIQVKRTFIHFSQPLDSRNVQTF